MPQIGPLEIVVVLLIALLVFGPNRLPEMARQVGSALRELRRVQQNLRRDLDEMMHDESAAAAPPPTLPPRADPDAGLPPGDVPTSGTAGDPPVTPPAPEPGDPD